MMMMPETTLLLAYLFAEAMGCSEDAGIGLAVSSSFSGGCCGVDTASAAAAAASNFLAHA